VPRSIEARLGGEDFRFCGPVQPAGVDLLRATCGAPLSAETKQRLIPLARGTLRTSRSLAAAVSLSSEDVSELSLLMRRVEAARLPASERQLALGALEHALAGISGDPSYLISALEHTEKGLAGDPLSLPGLFNRGLIAADLGLCRLAASTWRQYLENDPESGWGQEARARLSVLPCVGVVGPAPPTSPDELFRSSLDTRLPPWVQARQEGHVSPRHGPSRKPVTQRNWRAHD
jgi:hypothetical protein